MLECGRHPQKGAAQDLKGWYKALEDLVWLTQLGLNMLLPLVMVLGLYARLALREKSVAFCGGNRYNK